MCIYYCSKLRYRQSLFSRLQNALWNCHFLSELLFLSLCFLNVLTYNLLQELLFQKMQFFRANFQQTLKYLGSQSDALVTKSFHQIPRLKLCHQNYFLREALNRTNYRRIREIFVFGESNKNMSFSTKFQD